MQARLFYSFATELLKMAADIPDDPLDADIRELLADRRGNERYLPGGQLPSNSIADQEGQEYAIKLGNDTGAMNISSGVYDMSSKKKKHNTFQKARDYSAAAAKGGFVGIGGLEAYRKLRGQFDRPSPGLASKHLARKFIAMAAIGSGLSMLERGYRYNHLPGVETSKKDASKLEKKSMISPVAGRTFGSPGKSLANSRKVGMFETGGNKPNGLFAHTPRIPGI